MGATWQLFLLCPLAFSFHRLEDTQDSKSKTFAAGKIAGWQGSMLIYFLFAHKTPLSLQNKHHPFNSWRTTCPTTKTDATN